MADKYGIGKNIDESELYFLGTIESVDDIFKALDLELYAKKQHFLIFFYRTNYSF